MLLEACSLARHITLPHIAHFPATTPTLAILRFNFLEALLPA
jgi:hypothetical protein